MTTWNSQMHRWEGAGTLYIPLRDAPDVVPARSAEDVAALARLTEQACPRRIVLLTEGCPDAAIDRVVAEPAADRVHAEMVRLAEEYPGRILAAEWQSQSGWVRWLWKRGSE